MIKPFARTQFAAAILAFSVIALGATSTPASANSEYCDDYAQSVAHDQTRGKGTLGGALVGGTFGAIIGKVVGGNKGTGIGALIGGSTGAVIGTDRENRRYEAFYQDAYADCMQRASNTAQPTAAHSAYAPEPWTEDWYDYCAAKYRSFNPETGEFLAYSGEYKQCR